MSDQRTGLRPWDWVSPVGRRLLAVVADEPGIRVRHAAERMSTPVPEVFHAAAFLLDRRLLVDRCGRLYQGPAT
jgi:hypothetical protein